MCSLRTGIERHDLTDLNPLSTHRTLQVDGTHSLAPGIQVIHLMSSGVVWGKAVVQDPNTGTFTQLFRSVDTWLHEVRDGDSG